jgi:hypothetical protein
MLNMLLKNLLLALPAIPSVIGNPIWITVAEQPAHGVVARDDTCVDDRYATTEIVSNGAIS